MCKYAYCTCKMQYESTSCISIGPNETNYLNSITNPSPLQMRPNWSGQWVYPNRWGSRMHLNYPGSRLHPNDWGSWMHPNHWGSGRGLVRAGGVLGLHHLGSCYALTAHET